MLLLFVWNCYSDFLSPVCNIIGLLGPDYMSWAGLVSRAASVC